MKLVLSAGCPDRAFTPLMSLAFTVPELLTSPTRNPRKAQGRKAQGQESTGSGLAFCLHNGVTYIMGSGLSLSHFLTLMQPLHAPSPVYSPSCNAHRNARQSLPLYVARTSTPAQSLHRARINIDKLWSQVLHYRTHFTTGYDVLQDLTPFARQHDTRAPRQSHFRCVRLRQPHQLPPLHVVQFNRTCMSHHHLQNLSNSSWSRQITISSINYEALH